MKSLEHFKLRRYLSLMIAVILVLSLLPMTAFAVDAEDGDQSVSLFAAEEQTIYLKGNGSNFTEQWNNVFYLGGAENAADPTIWHLVYTGNNMGAITEMQLTFKNGEVFNWIPSMGFSTNPGGNNPGWVVAAPAGWQLAYVNSGNNNESECYVKTTESGNINFNISGFHPGKGEEEYAYIIKEWTDDNPDGRIALFDIYKYDDTKADFLGDLVESGVSADTYYKLDPGRYVIVEQPVEGYDEQPDQYITISTGETKTVTFVNTPSGTPDGTLSIKKTVNGLEFSIWAIDYILNGGDLSALLAGISFDLYKVDNKGDDISTGVLISNTGELDATSGVIVFGNLDLADGWYAVVENLTGEAAKVFEKVDAKYFYIVKNGINYDVGGGEGEDVFDYTALYTIVNGYGGRYIKTLGYPGLNNTGDIFYIGVVNSGTGKEYPSFCAHAGSKNFAGDNGLGECEGYMVASLTEGIENTPYEDFLLAFNYIEAKYGNLNDNRVITQVMTWVLLGAIDIGSPEFAAANLTAEERAAVIDVATNYSGYTGDKIVTAIVYMICENPNHEFETCQPQIVPLYGSDSFDNTTKLFTSITLKGTKIIEGYVPPEQTEPFTFTIYDVSESGDFDDVSNPVSYGTWLPGYTHIEFDPILYDSGDEGKIFTYVIKEDDDLPPGWSKATGNEPLVLYVEVTKNPRGELAAAIYKSYIEGVLSDEITDIEDYLIYQNEFQPEISVEVDIDTIKRTSAAFEGGEYDVFYGNNLIDNVAQENYLYNVNFRNTSNVGADEFVVDIPLEAVSQGDGGYVRLETLWTPTVWGDVDGRMNVWYKSFKGSGDSKEPIPSGDDAITKVANPLYPTDPAAGWKLWTTIEQDDFDTNGQLIERVRLDVEPYKTNPGLNLDEDDYITAIRFEYGAVKVGFTSKNDEFINDAKQLKPLNQAEDEDGIRDTNGVDKYYGDGTIDPPVEPNAEITPQSVNTVKPFEAATAFFTGLFTDMFLTKVYASDEPPLYVLPEKGTVTDWTPDPKRSDYSEELDELNPTLKPATYTVKAVAPLTGEAIEIVSSVSALIGLDVPVPAKSDQPAGAGGGISLMGLTNDGRQYDSDQDAVLTRVLSPIRLFFEPEEYGGYDNPIEIPPRYEYTSTEDGVWYNDSNRTRTGDDFMLSLWMALTVAGLACLSILIFTFIPSKGGKRKTDIVSAATKGGAPK